MAEESTLILLFKFLHDLQKVFAYDAASASFVTDSTLQSLSLGSLQLNVGFFNEMDMLRSSCNDFTGI